MFKKKPLVQACAMALAAPMTVYAAESANCIGEFFMPEVVPGVTPPVVHIVNDTLPQLTAGESLVLSTDATVNDGGTASFFWCAEKGDVVAEATDFSQLKYTAPLHIETDQLIRLGVQIGDESGYVGGDNLIIHLIASSAGQPYIIVGTAANILIYSPTGDLKHDFAAIANKLTTLDSDEDGRAEIAASDGSQVAIYEFNGQTSNPNSAPDSVFTVKADVNGDGTEETIIGAQEANEVSVEGVAFPVFESVTETRRATRKAEKVTICHKGQTKQVAEPAVEAHLGHGDTLGACGSDTNDDTQGNDDDDDDNSANDDDNGTGNNDSQVTICHIPPGNPSAAHTITISINALPAHLGHGDTEGACPDGDDGNNDDPNTGDIYGVNVAAGDLNGDGKAEIVAAMASKGGRIEIRSGNGTLINGFDAFDSTNGVLVAVGDVTGDGQADIIAAEVNGTEIRIFAADGTQIESFPVNSPIISLAVGQTVTEFETPTTPEDDSSTSTLPDEPLPPPTTGTISGISENYEGQTITDATIDSDSSISNVEVAGDTSNEGLLSNATVLPEGIVTGGTLTGHINNQGTITDTTFVGAKLTGGKVGNMTVASQKGLGVLINVTVLVKATVKNATVSGEIDNQGTLLDVTVKADTTVTGGTVQGTVQNAGTLADVSLAAGTQVEGGTLSDKIAGDADDKAVIENAHIAAGTELADVIIGHGTDLAANVEIGDGVRFANEEVIPEGADLTDAIAKTFADTLPDAVDMQTDVVTDADAPSLLAQVNDVPDLKEKDWQLTQDPETGELTLTVGDLSYAVIPVSLKHQAKKPHAGLTINPDGSVSFVTAKGRIIQAHPLVQKMAALREALAELEMTEVVLQDNGVLTAKFGEDSVAARADIAAQLVEDDEPLGLFPTDSGAVRLVFVDKKGHKRAQNLYPFCANPQALSDSQATEPDGSELELAHDGTVSLTIEGQRYHGMFDYMVSSSEEGDKPEAGELTFTPIVEDDKTIGFTVTYPTGDTQMLRLLGDVNP
mgnify:CR=1 FL=1